MKDIDQMRVATLGEVMIRLAATPGVRLERTDLLHVGIAGTEANVAVALSRLGVNVGWISKLVDNAWGKRIEAELRWHGVDTSRIIWTETGRVGTFFLEAGAKPRPSSVVYDRADSAASTMSYDDVDLEYVLSADHLHLTGITAAISTNCRELVARLTDGAQKVGKTISFDVNYRQKLWSTGEAFVALDPILHQVNLLITTREDAHRVLGVHGEPEAVCQELIKRYGCQWVVVTLGAEGAIGLNNAGFKRAKGYEIDVVDRVGAGDAFAAGALYGFLHGDLEMGLSYGTALAALKHTITGDLSYFDLADIQRLQEKGVQDIQR